MNIHFISQNTVYKQNNMKSKHTILILKCSIVCSTERLVALQTDAQKHSKQMSNSLTK